MPSYSAVATKLARDAENIEKFSWMMNPPKLPA
jgi:hypothetical protein